MKSWSSVLRNRSFWRAVFPPLGRAFLWALILTGVGAVVIGLVGILYLLVSWSPVAAFLLLIILIGYLWLDHVREAWMSGQFETAPSNGTPEIGCVLIVREGMVLAVPHHTPSSLEEDWRLPGGRTRRGEAAHEAARRAAKIHTGLTVRLDHEPLHRSDEEDERGRTIPTVTYLAREVTGVIAVSETNRVEWVPPGALLESRLSEYHRQVLKQAWQRGVFA